MSKRLCVGGPKHSEYVEECPRDYVDMTLIGRPGSLGHHTVKIWEWAASWWRENHQANYAEMIVVADSLARKCDAQDHSMGGVVETLRRELGDERRMVDVLKEKLDVLNANYEVKEEQLNVAVHNLGEGVHYGDQ